MIQLAMIEARAYAQGELIGGLESGITHRKLRAQPTKIFSESNGRSVVLARDYYGTQFV